MPSKRKRSLAVRFTLFFLVVAVLNLQTKLLLRPNGEVINASTIAIEELRATSAEHRSFERSTKNATTPLTLSPTSLATTEHSPVTNKRNKVLSTAEIRASSIAPSKGGKKCALLFFGLVKDFEELALPSIQKNIIVPNPHCDIFLHTYNITVTRTSRRNLEHNPYEVRIEQAFLLTDNVTLDTDRSFEDEHATFLRRTRRLYHREWGACCRSHDNMIRQWHSIKRVWDLMLDHERKAFGSSSSTTTNNVLDYQQIGLFRSDVYYTTPINIFDSNATLPNFAAYKGYNDRLFYGQRQHAAKWADRFSFAPKFERQYMVSSVTRGKKRGYHSETFLYHLMNYSNVPIEPRNICVWRIRAGSRLSVEDCTRDAKWFQKEDIPKHLPEGYVLKIVNDTRILRKGKTRETSSLWGFPPGWNYTA